MSLHKLGTIMNGVTGRMGTNQHLIRSIVAIRNQGAHMLSVILWRMLTDPRCENRLERHDAIPHYLWSLGFSVAEAMDTAQRSMGLDWIVPKS